MKALFPVILLVSIATAATAAVIVIDPVTRNGSFESDPYTQGWNITQSFNVTDASPIGPSAPTNGAIFVQLHPDDNTLAVHADQTTAVFPTMAVGSMDMSFDLAGVGPVVANQTYVSVRLWYAADAGAYEVLKEFLVFDGSPTTFQHQSYHVDGPFTDGGSLFYSDVNRAKVSINVRGITGGDTNAFIDNVVLALTPVPEPASLALLGVGGLVLLRRRPKQ